MKSIIALIAFTAASTVFCGDAPPPLFETKTKPKSLKICCKKAVQQAMEKVKAKKKAGWPPMSL